jgi:signal transduction histidine kinase
MLSQSRYNCPSACPAEAPQAPDAGWRGTANSTMRRLKLGISNADLRVKVAVTIVAPVMLAFFVLSIAYYVSAQRIAEQQAGFSAVELGDVMLGSLKHAMLANDNSMLQASLQDVAAEHNIARIWLLNAQSQVKMSSNPADQGAVVPTSQAGCQECHKDPAGSRPLALRVSSAGDIVRVAAPIANEPACQACHPADQKQLGVLLIDTSLSEVDQSLKADLQRNLLLSALASVVIGLAVYLALSRLIVRPIEKIHDAVVGYSNGDLTARVPVDPQRTDEIAVLGKTFNGMADSLAEQDQQRQASARVREAAIVEERERIARELHDGIAQFLGYVGTKTEAARIFLAKGQLGKVEESLLHLEDEARKQALDVRASILGLNMFTSLPQGLGEDVRICVTQSNRFMDLEIQTEIDPTVEDLRLDAETELQLLRILQEAISNIRKHSQARTASVGLRREGPSQLELVVHDDGIGFDPPQFSEKGQPHFGLATMRERASDIGADFEIVSSHMAGTTVSVRLKLPGSEP